MLSGVYVLPKKKGDEGFSSAYIFLVLELFPLQFNKSYGVFNGGYCHGTELSESLKSQIMFNCSV